MFKFSNFLIYCIALISIIFTSCNASEASTNEATSVFIKEENKVLKSSLEKTPADPPPKKGNQISDNHPLGHGYNFDGNGKRFDYEKNDSLFVLETEESVLEGFLNQFAKEELEALSSSINKNILRLGKKRYSTIVNGKTHTQQDLIQAQKHLLTYLKGDKSVMNKLSLLRIRGEDSLSNVHFTGYYTPVLKIRKTKDDVFKYPLYRSPKIQVKGDTRGKIMEGEIYKGYEIGFTDDLLTHYSMQVQGSGMVEYPDGTQKLLKNSSFNGYSYTSLGKYFVKQGYVSAQEISYEKMVDWFNDHPDSINTILNYNKSYVFFSELETQLSGAANIPLSAGHSIAIDSKLFPYGAVFFGEKPVINSEGLARNHKKALLFSHDRGGAIKGSGHMDFYCGTGEKAYQQASVLHHYGYVWLLSLKK